MQNTLRVQAGLDWALLRVRKSCASSPSSNWLTTSDPGYHPGIPWKLRFLDSDSNWGALLLPNPNDSQQKQKNLRVWIRPMCAVSSRLFRNLQNKNAP